MRRVQERLNWRRAWRGACGGPIGDAAAVDVHSPADIAASGLGGRRPLFSPRVSRPLHRGLVCLQPATSAAARMPSLQGCFQKSDGAAALSCTDAGAPCSAGTAGALAPSSLPDARWLVSEGVRSRSCRVIQLTHAFRRHQSVQQVQALIDHIIAENPNEALNLVEMR